MAGGPAAVTEREANERTGFNAENQLVPLAGDRLSLSRVMLRGVNHPSEVTESPIEIQLRALRTTLGDDLVRDLEDSVAPNTWRAYRSDLADFATWVAYTRIAPTQNPGHPRASRKPGAVHSVEGSSDRTLESWARVVADEERVSNCWLVRIHRPDGRNAMLDMRVPQEQRVHRLPKGARPYRLSFVRVDRADSSGDVAALDQLDDAELLAVVMRPLRGGLTLLRGRGGNPDLMDVHEPRVGEAVALDRQLPKEESDELVQELITGGGRCERSEMAVDSACVGVDLLWLEVGARRQHAEIVATRAEVEEGKASTTEACAFLKVAIRLEVVPLPNEATLGSHQVLPQPVACRINLSEPHFVQRLSDPGRNRDPGMGAIVAGIGHCRVHRVGSPSSTPATRTAASRAMSGESALQRIAQEVTNSS